MLDKPSLPVTLKALLAYKGVTVTSAAEHLGISRSAMYERMAGATQFKASELQALADFLGVSVNVLFDGLEQVAS